jgi:hypothetical protein
MATALWQPHYKIFLAVAFLLGQSQKFCLKFGTFFSQEGKHIR